MELEDPFLAAWHPLFFPSPAPPIPCGGWRGDLSPCPASHCLGQLLRLGPGLRICPLMHHIDQEPTWREGLVATEELCWAKQELLRRALA